MRTEAAFWSIFAVVYPVFKLFCIIILQEKELRDSTSHRHSQTLQEVTTLKEKLQENDFLREQLRQEQDKSRQYLEQVGLR